MAMTLVPPPIVPGNVITQEFRTPKTVQRGIAAGVVGNRLLARTGHSLAPAVYLAAAAALAFFAALLLPRAARHGITQEFAALRLR